MIFCGTEILSPTLCYCDYEALIHLEGVLHFFVHSPLLGNITLIGGSHLAQAMIWCYSSVEGKLAFAFLRCNDENLAISKDSFHQSESETLITSHSLESFLGAHTTLSWTGDTKLHDVTFGAEYVRSIGGVPAIQWRSRGNRPEG